MRQIAMTPERLAAVARSKRAIRSLLQERQDLAKAGDQPSVFWTEFCSHFSYLIDLPDQHFSGLRLHTYHLTGDTYLPYFFAAAPGSIVGEWDFMCKAIPERYRIWEPEGGFGFEAGNGHLVNQDVHRFQRSIAALSAAGVLSDLETRSHRPVILEIGGGYGALAYHLTRIVPNAIYVIVDLPETLLYSTAYLGMLRADRRLLIHGPDSDSTSLGAELLSQADILFVPNYRLEALSDLAFDLVVNIDSFQEMRTDQVKTYLDFLVPRMHGPLLSFNKDRQLHNLELESLHGLLGQSLNLVDVDPLRPPGSAPLPSTADNPLHRLTLANPHIQGSVRTTY